jgi:hypothetical protein
MRIALGILLLGIMIYICYLTKIWTSLIMFSFVLVIERFIVPWRKGINKLTSLENWEVI